jgi:hypothetical protein
MAQGSKKMTRPSAPKKANSARAKKAIQKAKVVQKGEGLKVPKNQFRYEALNDRAVTAAIDKKNEQIIAGRVIQSGGKMKSTDLMQKGKELNKEERRKVTKRKVGRVEEKLIALKAKAEKQGLI